MPRPRTLIDSDFGSLDWDEKAYAWQGKSKFDDGVLFTFHLNTLGYMTQIPPYNDTTYDRTITVESREAFARVRRSHALCRIAVSKEYLPLYPRWNDGEKTSDAEFQRRLQLESVQVNPDGSALVFFGDGGMFGGHALISHVDKNGTIEYIEMFG